MAVVSQSTLEPEAFSDAGVVQIGSKWYQMDETVLLV